MLIPVATILAADVLSGVLTFRELAPLPDPVGVAGAYAGVVDGALVVAGGANFPGGRPWEGNEKIWHDATWVLEEPGGTWVEGARLPRPAAYGVSVTWTRGDGSEVLVCVGGCDAEQHFAEAFYLERGSSGLEAVSLPSLPMTLAYTAGALVGDVLYVAGGREMPTSPAASPRFFSLDLSAPDGGWSELPTWSGPERMLAVAGARDGAFYLYSGTALDPASPRPGQRVYLTDAHRYRPDEGWTRLADLPRSAVAAPGPAIALGGAHLAVIGGDAGTEERPPDVVRDEHAGFASDILLHDTITDTWVSRGAFPVDPGPDPGARPEEGTWVPVTATLVPWGSGHVLASGESRPGVRTSEVFFVEPRATAAPFGGLDWTVLSLYLLALVWIGVVISRRERGTEDFFLAGRRIPWWAAGLSIFGTQLSAITFMAIPAKSFETDWVYFLQNMGIVAIAPLVAGLYLPIFRRRGLTSAYEFLETRFGLAARLYGSASFMAYQLARMGLVLFLPALALAAITGLDVYACIALMGVLCTIYTVLGGIEAVIWTDVLQVVVLLVGAVAALFVVGGAVEGGLAEVAVRAAEAGKLRLADMRWDWSQATLGVILVAAVFNNLVPYTTDQAVVQRFLTTPDESAARRAVWTNALLSVPASLLFFGIGTALFVFYGEHPEARNPVAPTDQVFPWFIASELPVGLAGLVVAGIFAAAMSSLDSAMNSIATAGVTDFYRRFRPEVSDHKCLRLARILTLVLGVVGTATAMLLAATGIRSALDTFLGLLGLLSGALAGLFLLGALDRRAGQTAALSGVAAGIAALVFVRTSTDLSPLLNAAVGCMVTFVVGLVLGRVLNEAGRAIQA